MKGKHVLVMLLYVSIMTTPVLTAQDMIIYSDSAVVPEVHLGEVVIRASKDKLELKELPASVSLIRAESIRTNEVRSLDQVSVLAPNFYMPDYGSRLTSPVYIRGVGSRINAPSVGLYVDHVPYFEKASFDFDFFDIERIEVLKGPQGTLYGRNTMGGIINVVTRSPLHYQGTGLNITAGTHGQYLVNANHYARPSDLLAWSLAANLQHQNGFHTNQYFDERVDRMNSAGLRNRLASKISEKLTLEHVASFEVSRQGAYPYAVYNDSLGGAGDINYNQKSSYNRSLFSDAFVVNYQSENLEIISSSAYQLLDDAQKIDQDFTTDSLYFIEQDQMQHMLSQEVIIRAPGDEKYQWLLGGYAFAQMFDRSVDVAVYRSNLWYTKTYDHTISGSAFFHQSTLNDFLIPRLSVTAGIRFDYESARLNYTYDLERNGNAMNLADTLYPVLSYNKILPKIAVRYSLGRSRVYAVVSSGYKSGGFNSTFERPEDHTFKPEYSWNYEAGFKGSFFRSTIYADLALFYIDWKDQQIYQPVPSGRGSMLKNAGHSATRGIEMTIKTIPVRGFEAQVNYGYTHASFISHVVDTVTDHSGNFIPYVPGHTAAVQLSETIALKDPFIFNTIRVNLLYRGAGEIYWNLENSHKQDYYGLLDAKISFFRQNLQIDIWARNLLNRQYEAFFFEALGRKYVQEGRPLNAGINLYLNF